MLESPETSYEQHRKDTESVEKAQSAYDKHLKEAREAGDLTKHPELWDQASVEYQAEAKEKIAEAVQIGNYDVAEELIHGLRTHLDTVKKYEEKEETPLKVETPAEKNEVAPVQNKIMEEIMKIVSESDWKRAKDKALEKLDVWGLSQLAEMRTFDPERFDEEFDMERLWGRVMETVRREKDNPTYYLLAARDLKLVSKDNDRFLREVDSLILDKAVDEIRQRKYYPKEFIVFASALKDTDPEKFRQISNNVSDAWPEITKFIEELSPVYRPHYIGYAQNIKLDSKPDFTLNERAWQEYKQELEYSLHRRHAFDDFFRAANKVSHLKLEGEK